MKNGLKLKPDVDSGVPSPIWVVTSPGCPFTNVPQTVTALTYHHQVLVYGYLLDDSKNLTLNIYEPQGYGHDATIFLNISNPEHTINITAESINWAPVRVFFRSDYNKKYPQPFAMNKGGAPTATTLNATNITSTSATLNGIVNPKGFVTQVISLQAVHQILHLISRQHLLKMSEAELQIFQLAILLQG